MTPSLHFYTNPMSRGRIIRWMLEEVGAPYETTVLGFGTSMKTPEYLSVNPMGKVPAVVHGKTVVTECAAICAYLADAFPKANLAPELEARGDYFRWMFFAAGPLEQAVVNKALGVVVPDERKGMVGYGSFDGAMNGLEHALRGKQYVAGNKFTAADVYVGSQVGWGLQFGTIEKRPVFEAYWNGLVTRPAGVRAREIDDALIAKK